MPVTSIADMLPLLSYLASFDSTSPNVVDDTESTIIKLLVSFTSAANMKVPLLFLYIRYFLLLSPDSTEVPGPNEMTYPIFCINALYHEA